VHQHVKQHQKAKRLFGTTKLGARFTDEPDLANVLITEGGIKQALREQRKACRNILGFGQGKIVNWNWRAATNYTHCRTNAGNLQRFRHLIGKADSPNCRFCSQSEVESGEHIVFKCPEAQGIR
jgi:hypothetical protein